MPEQVPFVDAHHHLWDPWVNPHPWLSGAPPIPFRYGDYGAIRRPFLPDDYRRVSAGQDVVASVTMEGEWDPRDPLGETRWLAALARAEGMPRAHVAQAWLDAPDVEAVLAAQAAHPIVRGVRHKPKAAPGPDRVEPGAPGSMGDPAWRRGFATLARHGLVFDLQTPWWHLDEAVALGEAHPETVIVLNHAGLPADRSAGGLAAWRDAMRRFARLPQARVKISGLGLKGRPWRLADNAPIIEATIAIFGADRAMFASNFPVDGLCGTFGAIVDGFRSATADLSFEERHDLFYGTAARTYRVPLQLPL